jgi:hypothetical protein
MLKKMIDQSGFSSFLDFVATVILFVFFSQKYLLVG